MLFPTGDAYMLAVQNAWTAFQDADLKRSAVELTPLGLPKPYSGGFATTFRFNANGGEAAQWAVRCFKQELPDLPRRYAAMQRLWAKPANPIFVRADYLRSGIRVGPSWYPVVKMDWAPGELLGPAIQSRLYRPAALAALAEEVRKLAARLEELGMAHGDLQHGNIIVQNNTLRLIDYDGMYLPELNGMRVTEIGHVNFQHPGRANQHYNPHLDRFAIIVLYLGLQALSKQPSLWRKYDNGDNLLFRQADFIDPDASLLLADLAGIAGLSMLVERFRLVCRDDFGAIPTLDVFLAGSYVMARSSARPPRPEARPAAAPARRQYPVVDAASLGALSEYVGTRIEVIGRISQYISGRTEAGDPYLFLNFGEYPKRTLTVVVWARVLNEMQSLGVDPLAYVGKSVRVTGVVTMYGGRPQMDLESASQIRVIVSDARSDDELFAPHQTEAMAAPGRPMNGKQAQKQAQVLNTLYQDWPAAVAQQVELPPAAARPASAPPPQAAKGKAQKAPAAKPAAAKPAAARPPKVVISPTATTTKPKPKVDDDSDCFVATVAFGGPDAVQVQILRRFRDQTLLRRRLGRAFVAAYYRRGPGLARFVQTHPRLKHLSAAILARLAILIASHQQQTPPRP